MSSGLRRLRARTAGELSDEAGFTIIEMIVAITLLAVTMMSLAYGLFGGMQVLQAGRHKTTFLELANTAAEEIRAVPFDAAGVRCDDDTIGDAYDAVDPLFNPGCVYYFGGREAVVLSASDVAQLAADFPDLDIPKAVQSIPSGTATNRPAHVITRRVTWTDEAGGAIRHFKRIDVTIDWNEPTGRARSVSYTTFYYPGDLGPIEDPSPIASFTVTGGPVTPSSGYVETNTDIPTPATVFSFDGSASSDPSGLGIAGYNWDFGDGTTGTGTTASHSYATVGRKTVTLVVTNSAGTVSTPVSQTVFVGTAPGIPAPPGNVAPVAAFTAAPRDEAGEVTGPGPLSVSVDASASSDENGDPLTYAWSWGDGTPNGTGSASGHAYDSQGSYTLVLTVTDPAGDFSSASETIDVTTPICTVNSASFKNPGSNSVSNSIKVGNNDRPVQPEFVFTAVTNLQCTAMTVSVPTQSGSFNATLDPQSSTPTTRTWGVTRTDNSKYNTGNSQSATFTAAGTDALGAPASFPFTISFAVFR